MMERLCVSASHFVRNDIGLITHLPEVHEVPPFEGDMRSTSVIRPTTSWIDSPLEITDSVSTALLS
jgi:hypothetical protein